MNIKKKCIKCGVETVVFLWKQTVIRGRAIAGPRGGTGMKNIKYYRPTTGGRLWVTNTCGDCLLDRKRKSIGFDSRSRSKDPAIMAFVRSEIRAQEHFESLGFSVKRTDSTGPDLRCRIGDLEWTVEVKRATWSSGSWRTHKVRHRRLGDDLVAIVLPNDRVYIDSMKHHLAACDASLRRTVTAIVKEFGLPA